ncbi:MAG TPA: hypothetical protein VMZ71_10815, partial [Gemmataceae bacterium]|nr:hypothetical protein [Gemmataceae bacterium]
MAHDTDPADKDRKPEEDVYELPDFPDIDPVAPPESTTELSALPDFVPTADAASSDDLPAFTPSEPISSYDLPVPDPVEPLAPIAPASGWLEVPSDHGEDFPEAGHVGESSDIFAGGPVARAHAVDHSDVLRATATSPRSTPTSIPPGDHEDLPMAEELPDDEQIEGSSLFPENRPHTDRFGEDDDAHDYGANPKATADASNILADLSHGEIAFDHDASGVQLDSPGMSRTLSEEPPLSGTTDGTAIEPVPRRPFPAKAPPADWQPPSGSGLFSDEHTVADDDDAVNPF